MLQRNKLLGRRRVALILGAIATLSGAAPVLAFDEYFERRDTITLGVGDAIAVNKATQTINRWPKAARQDYWVSDGERARITMDRYRKRTGPGPAGLGSPAPPEESPTTDAPPGATTGK